jgi:hypothetical protein
VQEALKSRELQQQQFKQQFAGQSADAVKHGFSTCDGKFSFRQLSAEKHTGALVESLPLLRLLGNTYNGLQRHVQLFKSSFNYLLDPTHIFEKIVQCINQLRPEPWFADTSNYIQMVILFPVFIHKQKFYTFCRMAFISSPTDDCLVLTPPDFFNDSFKYDNTDFSMVIQFVMNLEVTIAVLANQKVGFLQPVIQLLNDPYVQLSDSGGDVVEYAIFLGLQTWSKILPQDSIPGTPAYIFYGVEDTAKVAVTHLRNCILAELETTRLTRTAATYERQIARRRLQEEKMQRARKTYFDSDTGKVERHPKFKPVNKYPVAPPVPQAAKAILQLQKNLVQKQKPNVKVQSPRPHSSPPLKRVKQLSDEAISSESDRSPGEDLRQFSPCNEDILHHFGLPNTRGPCTRDNCVYGHPTRGLFKGMSKAAILVYCKEYCHGRVKDTVVAHLESQF